MRKLPNVVLVGRTNVGKSTLFNRLSVNVKSIVLDYEGVTRDFLSDEVCWNNICFRLMDSGGISLKKSQDPLAEKVRHIALELLQSADVILFVCDGIAGLTTQDRDIAKLLHKLAKPVILIINKIDAHSAQDMQYEFDRLGFMHTIPVSAQHGTGIADLLDAVLAVLPKKMEVVEQEKPAAKVVLLGKPNVGKSSLMNLLLEKDRVLVTPQAGTTREAITEPIRFYQETLMLTDTPGIRRKRAVEDVLEKMMVKTSFRAIDHADVVLLLIDGSEGILSDQELKLAFYILEQGKALILVVNKTDLMDEEKREALEESYEMYKQLFRKVPVLYISCLSKKNVGKILTLVHEVWQRYNQEFSDYELTKLFKEALEKTPLYHTKMPLMLFQAKQIAAAPVTILLKVNQPTWFGDSQLSFFDNKLRAAYNLIGVPVMYVVRKKS